MIKTLFPKTKNIQEVENIINKYKDKFGLNTNLRLAQFLAQVREEIGPEFKPLNENLNYTESSVLKTFKNFTPELAEKYARDEDTPVADQVAIANIAYANKNGNGSADTNKNGKFDTEDDGWKYRGRGVLQITGKYNYEQVQKRIEKYAPEAKVNILTGEGVDTLEGSILIGMAFWMWKDLYKAADTGNPDNVTAIINKYTKSYDSRKAHFEKLRKFL